METEDQIKAFDELIEFAARQRIIKDRRFLDDEQLIQAEQTELIAAIFHAQVRQAEIKQLTLHFADILRAQNPMHLLVWGKTGTGKTLTLQFFLGQLAGLCQRRSIPFRYEHLDLSTPRPCFRALNDLACKLGASRRYRQGISLEEMMGRIEDLLMAYEGYLVLFVDECDNVRRDADTFYTFLIRRFPQKVRAKLTLILTSNKVDWASSLNPRVKSFLRANELFFTPYDAMDLERILSIRVEHAIDPAALAPGVIQKIAALASREHGDARKAVTLLAKSAHLAEAAGTTITLDIVDTAAQELERDRYVMIIRTAPVHMQATMLAIIEAWRQNARTSLDTGDAYAAYREVCTLAGHQQLSPRAFGDLIGELGLYSFVRVRVLSRGRHGRTRDIVLDLPQDVRDRIRDVILLNLGLQRSS